VARGYSTLKFKLGRPGAFDAELGLIREVRRRVGPEVRLRLDANRAFPQSELAERLAALADVKPEFLEEPSDSLPDASPIPLALDESLSALDSLDPRLAARGVVAVVLKPGVLGGLLRARELARKAASIGLVPVVSHAFEGPLGHAAACELALALGPSRYAAGLAPHAALPAWGIALPRACSGAGLRCHDAPGLGLETLRVRA
jgi:O-succinylbenzoate synthase